MTKRHDTTTPLLTGLRQRAVPAVPRSLSTLVCAQEYKGARMGLYLNLGLAIPAACLSAACFVTAGAARASLSAPLPPLVFEL